MAVAPFVIGIIIVEIFFDVLIVVLQRVLPVSAAGNYCVLLGESGGVGAISVNDCRI